MPRTSYIDNVVPSLPRSFDQRSQAMQRNRFEHAHEINNTNTHYSLPHHHHRNTQPSLPLPTPTPPSMTQPRHIYHPSDHRQFLLESPPVASPRRQPIPSSLSSASASSRSSYTQQQATHNNHHHQRTGIPFESVSQRAPLFHRTAMTTHLHQRPATSFLTDLLQ